MHVAGGRGPFAPQVSRYVTDDGFRPMTTGSYSASWNHQLESGSLTVSRAFSGGDGDKANPVGFDCCGRHLRGHLVPADRSSSSGVA